MATEYHLMMENPPDVPAGAAAGGASARRVDYEHSAVGDAAIVRLNLRNNALLTKVDRGEKLVNIIAVCPLLVIAWVCMYILVQREAGGESAIAMASIVTVLVGVLMVLWAWSSGRWWQFFNKAQATARTRTEREPRVRMELEVSPRGVRVAHDDQASEFGWKYFDRVLIVEECVAFCFADAINGLAVPTAAFESRAAAEEFCAFARGCLEASGFSAHERWRTASADRSLPCPRCRYDLKGLARAVCPEGEYELDALSIRLLAELDAPLWTRLRSSTVLRGVRSESRHSP